jgi:tetratricopeptide (TPR) repeat protein
MAMGRTEESLAAGERAFEIEPFDLGIHQHTGWHYISTRKYEKAIEHLQETLKLDPEFYPPNLMLGIAYGEKNEFSQAIAYLQKARQLENIPLVLSFFGYIYAVSRQRNKALMLLNELSELSKRVYVAPYDIALIHAGLGDKERAFEYLERAYQDRNEPMCWLNVNPGLDSLRSDPRFSDLVRRIGLPPSP